ncbi:gluconate 2-dehydrogenase subunit 3 family protein [Aromatoleum diolicum]|uniref:Gluconate 2-dehydrogenase subunit 3 family protein n=1 Tax=Aromatoleum diolicum TaxID=75796 RepID=A0ABX1Q9T4_9RHOO|nr:gluconate 2-dehydrogenase subunit 3 family protein [Aromatoleum diolicum]
MSVTSKEQLGRRAFLKGSGLAAVGVAVLPAVGLMAPAEQAYAQKFERLSESVGKTLVKMARDIFPHDKVPDKFYAAAIASYDQKVAQDAQLKSMLDSGVAQLNAEAIRRYGKAYADVPGEGERVVLLYEIEQSAFFQKVRGDLIFGLYNNKEVWPLFGYEGSSWEKGGYLERGFNDIDWL